MVDRFIEFFTSLRLTVACLALALAVVFAGTLAQVDIGLYAAQAEYFRSFFVYWTPRGTHWKIPFLPGGWLIGLALLMNLLAAHIKRFQLSRDKIGLTLIHAGLILLLGGQFLTEVFQVESQMRIEVGGVKNYSESPRKNELAVMDTTDPDKDRVAAIPESLLARGGEIRIPELPFRLRVEKYYPNSAPAGPMSGESDAIQSADGIGRRLFFSPRPVTRGMDDEDLPVALVQAVSDKGPIGEWAVSTWLTRYPAFAGLQQDIAALMPEVKVDAPQTFRFNGRSYEIALRPVRYYKPYSIKLLAFHHDLYPGTGVPKNFSSKIHLSDPSTGDDRDILIYMNNPLRYRGETFYQAAFEPNDAGTILQVVRNPVSLAPYIACSLVALGLAAQFLAHLFRFARRRAPRTTPPGNASAAPLLQPAPAHGKMGDAMKKWLPPITAAIFASWFLGGFQTPKLRDGFNIAGFGRLPVLLDGRIQPLDSVARNALLSISGRSVARVANGPPLSASQWLLETMARPEEADKLKVFRIQHPDLEGVLGTDKIGLEYYSLNDLTNQWQSISDQARKLLKAGNGEAGAVKSRNGFQKDLMHLYDSVMLYTRLKNSLEPEDARDFAGELRVYQQSIGPGRAALDAIQQGKPANQEDLRRINAFFKRYTTLSEFAWPMIVPPLPGESRQNWRNIGAGLMETLRSGHIHPAAAHYAVLAGAFQSNNPARFNQALAGCRAWMQENELDPALKKGGQEFLFNQIEPFYKSMVLYVAALLLGCVFWINMSEPVRRTGFALLVLAFVIHSLGLGFRMWLEGRPPVTNLYSSAIFIGWGACLFGIFLEKIFKGGMGLVAAGFIGFATLIIAHHLALGGDTMEMLQAVLDTNLWLATHVVVVTLGYTAMFVAGLLAVIYILRGFFTRGLAPGAAQTLGRMVYGIVCFATLFSFAGTVLGGIWADQSWGRFWGWDPKENGALLIVLWNALILHARWSGMIRERGLMAMAVFGNIITSFSWFGVNMLGIGLHSYGFMDKAFPWLVGFDISQALLVALALMPPRYWASCQRPPAEPEA